MNATSTLKLRTYLLACTLGAVAMTSASHGFAQDTEMRVNVPFAFHNGSQRLPAGVYQVKIASEHVIELRGYSKSGFVVTTPEIGKPQARGKLVFQRYGGEYFLREVWAANSETGQKCAKSKLEREVEIANTKAAQPGAEVAINQQPR
ncbi:MAG TPA: hypothetical protein VGM02_05770 [Acidobacteriaceae bacterium]|jgi:hypothetical protein